MQEGYEILRNQIPSVYLSVAKNETLRLKKWLLDNDLIGTRSELGTGEYWRGIETSGRLSRGLRSMYEGSWMLNIVKEYLGDEFYTFNDQTVVKMPNEPFAFPPHFDNQYGQDPSGNFKTINFTWILDDQNDIRIKTSEGWIQPQLYEGDILVLDGNTLHCSGHNNGTKPRRNWCCVYAKEKPNYMNFYSEKVTFSS